MNEQVVSFEYPPVEEDGSLTQSTVTRVIYDRGMNSKIYFEIPTFSTFEGEKSGEIQKKFKKI